MFNLKKETIKKNIFLALSILFIFIFIAGVLCAIMGDKSSIQFIVNNHLLILIVPSAFAFFITFALYRNSKKAIEENTK